MKVVGFFPWLDTKKMEIQIYKNMFVKHGFIYVGTARTLEELHGLINHDGVKVLASKNFNQIGDGIDRLHLVMLLSRKGVQYFDCEVEDIANIVHLKEVTV